MKLLQLDTSIQGDTSVSRLLSKEIVDRLGNGDASVERVYRDLVADPIPHLSAATFAALTQDEAAMAKAGGDAALSRAILDEFLAADTIVIGVAFYNFTIASQLKAWIDRITVPGRTYRYTENGPQGLAGDKRVILAFARGGFYGPGTGREGFEHAESYLRAFFGFLGVTRLEVVEANGIKVSPERREEAIAEARAQIAQLAA